MIAMETNSRPARRPRGRPRAFDREVALDRAMHLFWEQGYETTSVAELTAAMGIAPPSLYAAFGDKEGLFRAVVERYETCVGGGLRAALDGAPTARDAVAGLLAATAASIADGSHPPGCLLVLSATRCSAAGAAVGADLAARRRAAGDAIRARIDRGIAEGDVPAGTDAGALARFYATVVQGLSIQALDGAAPGELAAVVEAAMRAWPGTPAP